MQSREHEKSSCTHPCFSDQLFPLSFLFSSLGLASLQSGVGLRTGWASTCLLACLSTICKRHHAS